ncbi:MAG: hypothetical protein U0166_23675 [Acidobacteriota bacterium]
MTIFIAAVAFIALDLFAIQVLIQVDLPKYRALIFKLYGLLVLITASAAGFGAATLGSGAWTSKALVVTGGVVFLVAAQRTLHYHRIRREFDLPPALKSNAPEVQIEGPTAQAAKRKASRMGSDTKDSAAG